MCAPLAALPLIMMIGAGMSAAAGGVATIGKIQQDNAAATVAQANAASQQQAEAVDQTNMNQSALQRYRQIAQVQGQQTTAAAAGAVAVGFGTAGNAVNDTGILGSEDVNKIYRKTGSKTQAQASEQYPLG